MRWLVKPDLNMKSRAKETVQALTADHRRKRVEHCKAMLNALKRSAVRGGRKVIVFSDEKNWTVSKYHNCRNDRYIAKAKADVDESIRFVSRAKHPQKAMSFGLVGTDGFGFKPIWIDGKLNSMKYIKMLNKEIILALNQHYGPGKWVLQQDGAPCHMSKATQRYLEKTLGSSGFWSKKTWPPNSPNLNLLDYHVWMRVEKKVCKDGHPNLASLKAAVKVHWADMFDASLIKGIKSFGSHIEKCITAEGSVFEK